MESLKAYRWDRRERRKSQTFDASGLFYFQCLQILLAFFLLFIGLRLIGTNAIIDAKCLEMVVTNYSAPDGTSVYRTFYNISLLCIAFAVVIGITFRKSMRVWWNLVFQTVTVLSFLTAAISFKAFDLPDIDPPDGTLAAEDLILSFLPDGSVAYNTPLGPYSPYVEWRMMTPRVPGMPDGRDYNRQRCVWLDKNLITVGHIGRDDNYALIPENERSQYLRNTPLPRYGISRWPEYFILDWTQIIWVFFTNPGEHMDYILDQQNYRPMTLEERERFLKKQACIKENVSVKPASNFCRYYQYLDWEKVPLNFDPPLK